MTPTPQAIESAARAIYTTWAHNRRVEETWDEIVHLGHSIVDEARQEAKAALSCDLGDMVLVPKAALDWLHGEWPDHEGFWFGEKIDHEGPFWWRSRFRAMLAAAEGESCK